MSNEVVTCIFCKKTPTEEHTFMSLLDTQTGNEKRGCLIHASTPLRYDGEPLVPA